MQHDTISLFQTALTIKSGDTIVIPCRDYKEMEAIRRSFYRELKKLKKISSDLAAEVGIHRRVESGTYAIVLSKLKTKVSRAFLVTKDGRVEEITKPEETSEMKRIQELMAKDGFSPEEIEEFTQSKYNFSEIEGDE